MNLIELHILQSFPVTCLNRDDLGAPKSAFFGGVQRARVSSQCWKRAVREFAHDAKPELFGASRSKILGPAIEKAAKDLGADEKTVAAVKEIVLDAMNRDDKKQDMVKTLFFFSPESLKNVVRPLVTDGEKTLTPEIVDGILSGDEKKIKKAKKYAEKISKDILKAFGDSVTDAADIALFGRMVADDASQTVEGAAVFSHALSTHVVRSELDFFSAVDDEKKKRMMPARDKLGRLNTVRPATIATLASISIFSSRASSLTRRRPRPTWTTSSAPRFSQTPPPARTRCSGRGYHPMFSP